VSAASLSRYGTLEVRFFRTLGFCPRYDFKRLDRSHALSLLLFALAVLEVLYLKGKPFRGGL
jgi:hypothetical protein